MEQSFLIHPIGVVHKQEDGAWVAVAPEYREGLRGLEDFSHIILLYWFDRNDTPEQRSILQVHPRKDPANPLTGVFATHAPVRPNLIAVTVCRLLSVKEGLLQLEALDALDGSPVIDIKGHIPCRGEDKQVRVPAWVSNDT